MRSRKRFPAWGGYVIGFVIGYGSFAIAGLTGFMVCLTAVVCAALVSLAYASR